MGADRPCRAAQGRPHLTSRSAAPERPRRTLHGRSRGRPLGARRRHALAALLPGLKIERPTEGQLDPARLFDRPVRDLWLEVGFGGGEHLAAQAAAHPDTGFVGCEPFLNGVAQLLVRVEDMALGNVRVFVDDARLLLDALPDACVGRAFVLFPDPWPKARHHRRRFIVPGNLDALARVLRDGAALRMASDHMGYVRWMLFHTLGHGAFDWTACGPADWRSRPDDWPATRYEAKALERGARCAYLQFRRRPRAG